VHVVAECREIVVRDAFEDGADLVGRHVGAMLLVDLVDLLLEENDRRTRRRTATTERHALRELLDTAEAVAPFESVRRVADDTASAAATVRARRLEVEFVASE
jgi:hypothetical protein